ncbi:MULTISPECIES: TerB family tellurite resistance protein [unclassified Cyanobium]|uniref:tellurite resistance TerB family protein n=1 Tax=unclassified Cyanobium TaxID=2627006 RepID=UPI0020CEAE30|nr:MULTISPECIES: TerB family tellurite resistance protein [unclassified Cyanobium]MCP9834337.1 TerB family tellurite resistance protein [Cyanobium sp. La Preciosa 7G6]MCP9937027.1 TerB family tellurite resistance protein [Cyanobium sp. Aljojuca 7A6]
MAELTPAQAALLRIVCTVAWADGECSTAERELLAELVARHLHGDSPNLVDEAKLEAFLAERLPVAGLDALVDQLGSSDARQLALKLSYMMVRVGRRSPAESSINAQERLAYRHLVELLGLDDAKIQEIEWAAEADLPKKEGLAQLLAELTAGWRSPDDGRGPA